jgi:hypothetical protein
MSAAAIAADPAVVSAKPTAAKPAQAHREPPKPEKPKSSALVTMVVKSPAGDNTYPEVDFATHVVVHTALDGEYVSVPRASARNIPGLVVPAEGADPKAPVVIDVSSLHAPALIALNEWIEKKGTSGVSTAPFSNPVTHTEIAQLTADEWEKDFSKNLLKSGEAILGCINFAEKNGMKGLHQFAIVALSCALRGKSEHEMALAMGHNADAFSESEITQGRAAFPEAFALTKSRA